MSDERIAQTLLRYVVDEASVKAASDSAQRVKTQLSGISDPLGGMGAQAKASVDATRAQFARLEMELGDLARLEALVADEWEAAAREGTLAASKQTDAQSSVNDQLRDGQVLLERYIESVEKLANTQTRAAASSPVKSALKRRVEATGDISTTLSGAASLVGAGGANVEALRLGSDVFGVLEYLPRFKDGLKEIGEQLLETGPLTTGFAEKLQEIGFSSAGAKAGVAAVSIGAMAVATVALSVAVQEAQRITEESARVTKGAIAAQEEYYTAVGKLTTAQVQQRVEELETERRILELRRAETQRFLSEAEAAIDNGNLFVNVIGNAAIALGSNVGGIQDLRDLSGDLDKQLATTDQSITRLNQGLEANAFAANDAAKAASELAAREAELAAQRRAEINREVELQTDANRLRREGTSDEIQRRIDALMDEAQAIQSVMPSQEEYNKLTDEQAKIYQDLGKRYSEIGEEIQQLQRILNEDVLPREKIEATAKAIDEMMAAANERVQQFVKKVSAAAEQAAKDAERARQEQIKAYEKAVGDRTKADEKFADAQKAYTAAVDEANRNAVKIRSESAEREAELEKDAADQRAENLRSAQTAREKQERDHQKALLDINQRANASLANAIRTRDVVAAILARETRKRETDAEEAANKDKLNEIEDGLKEQTRVLEKRLAQQLEATRASAAKQLQTEQERAGREIAQRRDAMIRAQRDLQNAQAVERALHQNHWVAINRLTQQGLTSAQQMFAAFASNLSISASRLASLAGAVRPGALPTPLPAVQQLSSINNITVNAATSTKMVRAVSNREARQVMYQVLKD